MAAASAPLSLRYHSDQLVTKVTSGLQDFYLSGHFCDIILNVGALKIRAHRVVLAAFSPYFRDLLLQPTCSQCSEITLRPHLKEEAVRQLIDFCYSSDITVDSQSADNILTVANFLQVKEVEKLCITFLAAQQALKPEVGPPLVSPQLHSMQVPVSQPSPQQYKAKGDNSNQVVCADTSGIGSNQTSPRQSSRPSSVPSGSGSVFAQPIEDGDSGQTDDDREHGAIEVKKEQEDAGTEPSFFSTPSSASIFQPDYDALRTPMSGFSGFYFPPTASALNMPRLPSAQTLSVGSQHLLMKALTHSASSPPDIRHLGEMYSRYIGLTSGAVKDETANSSSAEVSPVMESVNNHQCHVCLKVCSSLSELKTHLSEHRDMMLLPSASPYKMMSPVRKFSNTSLSPPGDRLPSYSKDSEEFGSSNMCGTCGKCFRDSQSLKFHRYNHVLRYQCNFCGKRFSRSWNLHRHRKTHYRQLHDGSVGSDLVSAIDVDTDRMEGKTAPFAIDVDNQPGVFRSGNVDDAAIRFAPYTVGSNSATKSSIFRPGMSGILDYSSYTSDGRRSSEPVPLTIEAGKTASSGAASVDKSAESPSKTSPMSPHYSMHVFDKAESPHGNDRDIDMSDST